MPKPAARRNPAKPHQDAPPPPGGPPRLGQGAYLTDAAGLERLVFFSDAVFAIAITLLVLDIRLPAGAAAQAETSAGLLAQLIAIWPKYLAYVISFLVIGQFWMSHHHKFRFVQAYDRRLVALNMLLLLTVAFLPFPTTVISEHTNSTAVIFYALAVALAGLVAALLWEYASRRGLIDPALTPAQRRRETLRGLVVPAVFLVSAPVALVNSDLATFLWILIAPIVMLLRLD